MTSPGCDARTVRPFSPTVWRIPMRRWSRGSGRRGRFSSARRTCTNSPMGGRPRTWFLAAAETLGSDADTRRVKRWVGGRGGGGNDGRRTRHRHRLLDPHAGGAQRDHRPAADLRQRVGHRGAAGEPAARHRRTHGAKRCGDHPDVTDDRRRRCHRRQGLDPNGLVAGLDREIAGLRIAVPDDFFFDEADAAIAEAVHEAVRVLERRGARIVRRAIPGAAEAQAN